MQQVMNLTISILPSGDEFTGNATMAPSPDGTVAKTAAE